MDNLIDIVFEKYKEHLNFEVTNEVVRPEYWRHEDFDYYPRKITVELFSQDKNNYPSFKIEFILYNVKRELDLIPYGKSCLASFLSHYGKDWEKNITAYFRDSFSIKLPSLPIYKDNPLNLITENKP